MLRPEVVSIKPIKVHEPCRHAHGLLQLHICCSLQHVCPYDPIQGIQSSVPAALQGGCACISDAQAILCMTNEWGTRLAFGQHKCMLGSRVTLPKLLLDVQQAGRTLICCMLPDQTDSSVPPSSILVPHLPAAVPPACDAHIQTERNAATC